MVGKVTVTEPVDEVVDLVSALIRFDTSNTGELETTKGEADCARCALPDRLDRLNELGDTDATTPGSPHSEIH